MNIAVRRPSDSDAVRAWFELRHARIRLALAENDIAWAQAALKAGHINPAGALAALDDALDEIAGVAP